MTFDFNNTVVMIIIRNVFFLWQLQLMKLKRVLMCALNLSGHLYMQVFAVVENNIQSQKMSNNLILSSYKWNWELSSEKTPGCAMKSGKCKRKKKLYIYI